MNNQTKVFSGYATDEKYLVFFISLLFILNQNLISVHSSLNVSLHFILFQGNQALVASGYHNFTIRRWQNKTEGLGHIFGNQFPERQQ